MKIMQINAVYGYSSTGRLVTELHNYLLSRGINSYVAANNVKDSNYFIKLSSNTSRRLHSLLSHLTGRQGYYSYCSTKKLLTRMSHIKPDVVHLHVLHSNCVHVPLLLEYLAKHSISTVLTLHDCWYFTGHCCYFIDSACERWKIGCGHCPDLRKWNSSWIFDKSEANLSDKKKIFEAIPKVAVVGVSDWVTGYIGDSILKYSYVIRRIYNWVDISKFRPNVTSIRKAFNVENDFVVLGVAQNWFASKGLDDIRIIAELRPDYKFVIVGNVFEESLPLPSNVIIVGVISSEQELADYYACADAFINLSIRETFGLVTIEAMACGTPVIAYNLTANSELINEDCGFLCEYKDYDSVIQGLDVIHDKGKNYYSKACVEFTISNFDKNILMNDYIQLYNELI
jgi:glycosyltransferase involved in cell wall biosynthesis